MTKKMTTLLLVFAIVFSSTFGVYADDTTVSSEYETEIIESEVQDGTEQEASDTNVAEDTEDGEEETSDDTDVVENVSEEKVDVTEVPDISEEAGEPAAAFDGVVLGSESSEKISEEALPKEGDSAIPVTADTDKENADAVPDEMLLEEQGIVASGKCGQNLRWSFDSNGTLTITGSGRMDDYFCDYADYHTDLDLYGDPGDPRDLSPWCSYKDRITNVILPNGLTYIGDWAFYNCPKLKTISIPNTVTSIGGSFEGCANLNNVVIPNSVTSIGPYAFSYCPKLSNISIPDSVTVIKSAAFEYCTSLESITIPSSVVNMGKFHTFLSCTSLKSIVLPSGITKIPKAAFMACESLTTISMTNSMKVIESGAFLGCDSLSTVNFYGTEAEWNKIDIAYNSYGYSDNEELKNAKKNFNVFLDVPPTHSYSKAIYWAVKQGIAEGYTGSRKGYFGVKDNITRGQVVMFLWRAAGKPNPKKKTQTFTDVPTSHNFFKAIQWANEQGITAGYSSGKFGPNNTCKRGQICTFLWRFAGKPAPKKNTQSFKDVPKSHGFYKAVQWASEQKITAGIGNNLFGVDDPCTRGQCVTFLYRFL